MKWERGLSGRRGGAGGRGSREPEPSWGALLPECGGPDRGGPECGGSGCGPEPGRKGGSAGGGAGRRGGSVGVGPGCGLPALLAELTAEQCVARRAVVDPAIALLGRQLEHGAELEPPRGRS